MNYQEIEGDIIALALDRQFDVICHGVNCFSRMENGLAPKMAKAFGCDGYVMENDYHKGDINKLGTIDYQTLNMHGKNLSVVNCYTQYGLGKNHPEGTEKPLDYQALMLCLRKMNHIFKGKHIGIPQIGCGLGGGEWKTVKLLIQNELADCDVTVIIYKPTMDVKTIWMI